MVITQKSEQEIHNRQLYITKAVFDLCGLLNRLYTEDGLKRRILKLRNRKPAKYALKIHGRHSEDYILIENLNALTKIEFAGEQFPVQPDVQRMLDSIYGAFDINKIEENRHE